MTRPAITQRKLEEEQASGARMFMGIPDRWYEDLTFRCEHGHISKMVLKSEALGDRVCLKCHTPVWITFPEDNE